MPRQKYNIIIHASFLYAGGLSAGGVVGLVAALFIVTVLTVILYAYRDKWLPMIWTPASDVRHLVQYNARDDENGVAVDGMDARLSFPDLDQQPGSGTM